MDAANFTVKRNDLYVAKQRYLFSGVEHIQQTYSAVIRHYRSCYS